MITIQINEKPLLEAKDFMFEVGQKALKKAGEVKSAVQSTLKDVGTTFYIKPSKVAYYSSAAASVCSFLNGYFSLSNMAFTAITGAALDAHVKLAKKDGVSSEDKKLANIARSNLVINLGTSTLNGVATIGYGPKSSSIWAYVGLGGMLYNLGSDNIDVSVKV